MKLIKNTLLVVLLMSVAICAEAQNRGFKITGNVTDVKEGHLVLLGYNDGQKPDTLAVGELKDGAFELTGKVKSITAAYIFLDNKRVATLFLENKNFKASILADNDIANRITGNKAQEIYQRAEWLAVETVERQAKISEETSAARRIAIMCDNQVVMDSIQALHDNNEKWGADEIDKLYRTNANSYATAYLLAANMQHIKPELLQQYYNLLTGEGKNNSNAKDIEAYLKRVNVALVGSVAPDFSMKTPDGQDISLYSVKGKIKLVDVWASWCGPCRAENPNVVKVYEKYKGKGLEIFSVSLDEKRDAWIDAIKKDKLTWKHGSDLKGWKSDVCRLYGIEGVPFTILLDENNVVIAKNLRGEELEKKIAELLDK